MGDPRTGLAAQPALAELCASGRERLGGLARAERLEPGAAACVQGEAGSDLFVVESGRLEARRDTAVGPQTVAELGPGDLFGEISLLDGQPRSSTVLAVAPSAVWRLPGEELAAAAAADPELLRGLLRAFWRSLAAKVRHANAAMSAIMAAGTGAPGAPSSASGARVELEPAAARALLRTTGLGDPDLALLGSGLVAVRYAGGEVLFREREPGDALFVVAAGRVRISRHLEGLGEEALAILGPGEVFGEMALVDGSPRSADAIAHGGGCTVLAVERAGLEAVLERGSTEFAKLLCQMLCRRIRVMNEQLVAWRTMSAFG